jgi:hypothetical protein
MPVIELPYKPRPAFMPFHNRTTKNFVMVAYRGAGKTVAVVADDIRRCLKFPNQNVAFASPVYTQMKRSAWRYALAICRAIPQIKINNTDLYIEFPNGTFYYFLGADRADNVRSLHLNHLSMDEPATWRDPDAYPLVFLPMCRERGASQTFIGTPAGDNWFKDRWERAGSSESYSRLMIRASDAVKAGWLNQDVLDELKLDMTPGQYNQELECSFDAADNGGVFQRDMFNYYDPEDMPERESLWIFGASDYATGGGDQTVHGIFAHTLDDRVLTLDWWVDAKADSLTWAVMQHKMAEKYKVRDWLVEGENIIKTAGPFLHKMMQENNYHYQLHSFSAAGTKVAKSASARARMAQGKILFPSGGVAWVNKLEYELLAFNGEDGCKDDQVDVVSLMGRGLDRFRHGVKTLKEEEKVKVLGRNVSINDLFGN